MSSLNTKEIKEIELINLLYKNFPTLRLNQELIINWQVELLDKTSEFSSLSSILSDNIVLDIDAIDLEHEPNIIEILSYLEQDLTVNNNKDDDEEEEEQEEDNDEFKVIILEILIFIISSSVRLRILLHNTLEYLIDSFLKKLSFGGGVTLENIRQPSIISQYMRLIILYMEFGCDTRHFKKLINPLIQKNNPLANLILSEMLLQIFTKYHAQFPVVSITKRINFPFSNDNLKKNFTIHSWFKVNRQLHNFNEDPMTLFTISSSGPVNGNGNEQNGATLKIKLINYTQFMVEIKNNVNGSKIRYTFNHILQETEKNQGFIHFVLTYDNYTNLNLFIDGEYNESIPCPDLHKYLSNWNKISIGEKSDDIALRNNEIILRNLTILNNNLSYEWINLLYNLGLGFDWEVKDFANDTTLHLLTQLNHQGLFNVALKFNEIKEQKKNIGVNNNNNNGNNMLFGSSTVTTNNRNALATFGGARVKERSFQNIHFNMTHKLVNKEKIANSLAKIKGDNVTFDSNDFFQNLLYQGKKNVKQNVTSSVIFSNQRSIYQAFNVIGGSSVVLRILETSLEITNPKLRDSIVYTVLSLLLTLLSNNWRLEKEFESFNGYGILSVLLTKYKDFSNQLKFDKVLDDHEPETNLLNVLLEFSGHDFEYPYESAVVNPISYRILVLNFDLHYGTESFDYLLFQIHLLLYTSRHKEYNYNELRKMKILRKLVQFLKELKIDDYNMSQTFKEQLAQTLTGILHLDSSVETIVLLSSYIIFALYNNDSSTMCGTITLQVLTDYLCDSTTSIKTLKKFSRSITVHWILLLFRFQESEVVVNCGIRLLTKLLKVLGTHIIRKFFQLNHGLDVLTLFLKDWWDNETVLCSMFLASFGIDTQDTNNSELSQNNDLTEVLNSNINNLQQLIVPEFLLLLNNLVLNSMYTLSLKSGKLLHSNPSTPIKSNNQENVTLALDVLHLINQYITSIKVGFEKSKLLQKFYLSKDFLEGIVELLGYLKLSLLWSNVDIQRNMQTTYEKLAKLIASFYISNLSNETFLHSFEKLSDFTKIVLLDLVFPEVLGHINQFISVTNFVFNEKQFFDNTIQLLHHYNEELLNQNYFVSYSNFDMFLLCSIAVSELGVGHNLQYVKKMIGDNIIVKFLRLACDWDILFTQSKDSLDSLLKTLLYRQTTILQTDVITSNRLVHVITLLLGMVLTTGPESTTANVELPFNFLRTCYLMRQDEFPLILEKMNCDKSLMEEFFNNLVTKNDNETLLRLQKFPPFVKSILKEFQMLKEQHNKTDYLKVSNMISVTLHNGGKLGQMNSIYIKSFEKDCELIKSQTMNAELVKFNRLVQDKEESIKHLISTYHGLKTEISRLFEDHSTKSYVLDYIENTNRMRKRLVVEDQLPESERLTYNIDVPLKKIDSFTNASAIHQYDAAITATGIDTLSLSSNEEASPYGEDSFEFIESSETEEETEINHVYEDKNRKVSRSLYVGDQIVTLWNISQINGLVPIESLMILGLSHLYLIENYFHSKDGNVIDVEDAPPELRDPILQLVNSQSSNILKNDGKLHRSKNWSLDKLSCISKRHFLLRDIALEMFFSDGASILITCLTTKDRDAIYNKLYSFASGKGVDYDLIQALQSSTNDSLYSFGASSISSKLVSAFSQTSISNMMFLEATKKWKLGEMSNFYYLMIVNTLAGRTFNDLTQYPVFPWVIADYTSETLDLSDPRTFRDLSKPMGAQTPARANEFRERFEALDSLNDHDAPAFHYGTHYSSAMIVTSFLIRLKPYVQSYLLLQGGKFDHADRLFNSIERAWLSASRDNTTDVRELTPEFYYLPEFLVNENNFEFGKLQNGESSHDVELPPWAKGDPKIFIAKNREALESSYVSANLHLWIDLIFGYKQSGEEAVKALNVFHHLSYSGAINLDNINDEVEKRAVIGMINNFGQTPCKLFNRPHPLRDVLNLPNYYLTQFDGNASRLKLVFESKLKAPISKLEISSKNANRWVGRQNCISCEDDLLIRKAKKLKHECGSLLVNDTLFLSVHSSDITTVLQLGHKLFVTGAEDGSIYVWKCNLRPTTTLQYEALLRGHLTSVLKIVYTKSFKFGASIDKDGIVIIWDFIRFKYVRKLFPPVLTEENTTVSPLLAVSNESGNFATVHFNKHLNGQLQLFTINGELIISFEFPAVDGQTIEAITFATTNSIMVDNTRTNNVNKHIYWSKEILAVARKKSIELWELIPENGWELKQLDKVDLQDRISGDITVIELFKCSEVDTEDKLIRGNLKLVIGDSTGKVYTL